jgi:hypothetical protein
MKYKGIAFLIVCVVFTFLLLLASHVSQDFETSRRATPMPGTITNSAAFVNFYPPLRFEPNVGQSAKNVRFLDL